MSLFKARRTDVKTKLGTNTESTVGRNTRALSHVRAQNINDDPRVFYDIESCQTIVSGYGNKWDFKVRKILRYPEIMCYSYKRRGKKTVFVNRWDYATYADFLQTLSDVLGDSIAIAYNGIGFDNPMTNTEFLRNKVPLPSPYKVVDPLRVARSKLKTPSNSLNDIAIMLGLKPKETVGNGDLEDDWMTGHPSKKTVRLMKLYNNRDVDLLEEVYDILLPLTKNHPNMGDVLGKRMVCSNCGSSDLHIHKERIRANGTKATQYQCEMGHYSTDNTVKQIGNLRSS